MPDTTTEWIKSINEKVEEISRKQIMLSDITEKSFFSIKEDILKLKYKMYYMIILLIILTILNFNVGDLTILGKILSFIMSNV